MNKDKLSIDVKTVLEGSEPSDKIKQQLHSRRIHVLDQVAAKENWWSQNWLVPVTSITVILIAVALFIPYEKNEFAEMAELSEEELEIILTMDIEDIEALEFYDWLDIQERQTG